MYSHPLSVRVAPPSVATTAGASQPAEKRAVAPNELVPGADYRPSQDRQILLQQLHELPDVREALVTQTLAKIQRNELLTARAADATAQAIIDAVDAR